MTYYGKLCTLLYDLDKKYASEEELSVYTQHIKSKKKKIMEPMCGSGRFYIPLAKKGYNITGFDSSRDMLDSCKKRCSELGIKPDVFQADITTYKSNEKFDYIFIPLGSISLLTDDNHLDQSFKNISEYIAENGTFIFSFMNPQVKKENISSWKETMRYPSGDKELVCKQKMEFIPDRNLLDTNCCMS